MDYTFNPDVVNVTVPCSLPSFTFLDCSRVLFPILLGIFIFNDVHTFIIRQSYIPSAATVEAAPLVSPSCPTFAH
jgi:hypothetical protein